MTGTAKTVLLISGALLAYTAFAKVTAGGNLVFYPDRIHSIDLTKSQMKIYIRVQNTSNKSFIIKSFAGNVFADGYLFGNAENFEPTEVKPNSQIMFPVIVRFQWITIINKVLDAFGGGPIGVKMKLQANANVEGYQVPVTLNFNIGT